jgi:hypothetical protein
MNERRKKEIKEIKKRKKDLYEKEMDVFKYECMMMVVCDCIT